MDFRKYEHREERLARKEWHDLHKIWGLTHKDFTEILSAETLSVTGGIATGAALAYFFNRLELLPAFLIALPGFLEMRGSISGSLSARLSSALYLGYLKPSIRNQRILRGNVIAAVVLGVFVGLSIGLMAYALEAFVFGVYAIEIVFVMLAASFLSGIIEIPITVMLTFHFYRKGIDPTNVMGPYATTLADVVSMISVIIAAVLIL